MSGPGSVANRSVPRSAETAADVGADAGEVAHHVLVEPLAGADAEGEPAVGKDRHGCSGLRDDRRVVAEAGARDACGEADAARRPRDRAEHGPGERRVSLRLEPGMVVVAELDEVEAGLLGKLR